MYCILPPSCFSCVTYRIVISSCRDEKFNFHLKRSTTYLTVGLTSVQIYVERWVAKYGSSLGSNPGISQKDKLATHAKEWPTHSSPPKNIRKNYVPKNSDSIPLPCLLLKSAW
jgi:hypothetical protein